MKKILLSLSLLVVSVALFSQCSISVVSQTNPSCPGNCDGSITIQPFGSGIIDIIWWDTYETTATVSGLCAYGYSVQITDDTGCVANAYITLTEPNYPTINSTVTNELCRGDCQGSIELDITGDFPPYTVIWNYGEYVGDSIYGLCGGFGAGVKEVSYFADITDANGCHFNAYEYIMEGESIEIYVDEIMPSECTASGYIMITAYENNPQAKALYYTWSNAETTQDITNVAAGWYSVTVTNDIGCTNADTFLVPLAAGNFPELYLNSYQNTNCLAANNDNGYIVLNAVGTAPFNFTWSTGLSGQGMDSIGGLTPGIYRVTVTDSGGGTNSCANYFEYEILDQNIKIEVNGNNTDCPNYTNGSAYVYVNNGESPFTFMWDGGSTNDYINNLDAGVYQVTVTDVYGCSAVGTVGIGYYWGIQDSVSVTHQVCYGESSGVVRVTTNSPYPPYDYVWSNGMSFFDVSDTYSEISGLPAGIYSVTITDSSPFSYTCNNGFAWVELKEPTLPVTNTITPVHLTCYNNASGEAHVVTTGSWDDHYTYNWLHDPGNTTSDASGLSAGTYYFTVTDAGGCTEYDSVLISQPDMLQTDFITVQQACYGSDTASVLISLIGGTPPYNWSLDSASWQSNGLFTMLSPGLYTAHVTDAYNCYLNGGPVSVNEFDEVQLSVNVIPVACGTSSTGSAEVLVTQGATPVTYLWNSGGVTSLIENLIAGTYSVTVTDANGCTQSAQSDVLQLDGWQISGVIQSSAGPLGQDEAMVKMFVEVPNVYQITEMYSTTTLAGGNFVIEGQQAGFYRFAIRPDMQLNPLYLNTWYNGVVAWENAEVVNIMCGDTLSGFLMNVLELPAVTGNGSFSGYIYYWDNTKMWRAVGEPVEGAEVFVEQQPNDNPVANTNTDVNGYWEANNLEENYSYNIHVDVPGLPLLSTYSNIPVTSTNSDYENLNFYVDTTGQYDGIFIDTLVGIGGKTAEVKMTVFPNPVKDIVNVSISSGADVVFGWELFAGDGRLVDAGKDIVMRAGESQIRIPVVERGTYFLIITSDNNKFVKKLIKE